MKQYEAVIKVMEENGGYATLGYLYREVLKLTDVTWKTKTPHASIRRIVQDQRFFFKIKPGLWALKSYKDKLPEEVIYLSKFQKRNDIGHTYYQGLVVEIGNLQNYQTIVPNQDKRKKFLNHSLGDVTSLDKIYEFSYQEILRVAKTIDVIWFNQRKMPKWFFEIEYSTDLRNALLKFLELQDFNSQFIIVADEKRKRDFNDKIKATAFREIQNRVKFWSFDFVSDLHSKAFEYFSLAKQLNLS